MWKTIQCEPNYEVSDLGEIRNKLTLQVKSLRLNNQGYSRVTLYPSGKTYNIHRLVALTFLEDSYKDGYVVNHINGVKTDNKVENLEWVSSKENFNHALNAGLYVRKDISGLKNPMSKFTEDDLNNIIHLKNKGFTTADIAKELGFPYERVRRFLKGNHYS